MDVKPLKLLTVRERGSIQIEQQDHALLESSDEFWSLAEAGILSLKRGKNRNYFLNAGPYIGQFGTNTGVHVRVVEKVVGAVANLIRLSAPSDLRSIIAPSLHGDADTLLLEFSKRLVKYVSGYVTEGRFKSYLSETIVTSFPRGRIQVGASMRRLARGMPGRLVCTRDALSADLLVNQLLGLSLAVANRIFESHPFAPRDAALCRMYAALFEDVSWRTLRALTGISRLFDLAIGGVRAGTDVHTALCYGRALVLNLGAWNVDEKSSLISHSYFMNLETLFEGAVRQALCNILSDDRVTKGSFLETGLFSNRKDRYIVDPDIVISRLDDPPIAIDCKYKISSGNPHHPDLYQLIAHSGSLGAKTGVLIYPGDFRSISCVGKTPTGITLYVLTIRLGDLYCDLSEAMSLLAPPPPPVLLPSL